MDLFWFELAGHLKYTVEEIQDRMTHREFMRWLWLYEDHAFGELAQDMRTADMMAYHTNLNTPKGKKKTDLVHIGVHRTKNSKQKRGIVARTAEQAGQMMRAFAGKFGQKIED